MSDTCALLPEEIELLLHDPIREREQDGLGRTFEVKRVPTGNHESVMLLPRKCLPGAAQGPGTFHDRKDGTGRGTVRRGPKALRKKLYRRGQRRHCRAAGNGIYVRHHVAVAGIRVTEARERVE